MLVSHCDKLKFYFYKYFFVVLGIEPRALCTELHIQPLVFWGLIISLGCLELVISQTGSEHSILLPQRPKCWDCRYVLPCSAYFYKYFS
jgi:hypothetical protein